MKMFWSVFLAIIAAAVVIGIVIGAVSALDNYTRTQSRIRQMRAVNTELENQNKRTHEENAATHREDQQWRNTVITRQQLSFPQGDSYFTIPAGTKLEATSNDGVNAVVQYGATQLQVPLTDLDFPNRQQR